MKDYECFPSQKVGDSHIYQVPIWMTEKDLDGVWKLANRRRSSVGSTMDQITLIIRSELEMKGLK